MRWSSLPRRSSSWPTSGLCMRWPTQCLGDGAASGNTSTLRSMTCPLFNRRDLDGSSSYTPRYEESLYRDSVKHWIFRRSRRAWWDCLEEVRGREYSCQRAPIRSQPRRWRGPLRTCGPGRALLGATASSFSRQLFPAGKTTLTKSSSKWSIRRQTSELKRGRSGYLVEIYQIFMKFLIFSVLATCFLSMCIAKLICCVFRRVVTDSSCHSSTLWDELPPCNGIFHISKSWWSKKPNTKAFPENIDAVWEPFCATSAVT